jgi:HPt (histidine-containing phosphotransfer) domain-containing protein
MHQQKLSNAVAETPSLDRVALDTRERALSEAPGGFVAILESFQRDILAQINDIVQGHIEQDAARIQMAAHSLRSCSATIGAFELSLLARQIEVMASEEAIDSTRIWSSK